MVVRGPNLYLSVCIASERRQIHFRFRNFKYPARHFHILCVIKSNVSFESMSESFCGFYKCLLGIFSNCLLMYLIRWNDLDNGWTGRGEGYKFQVYIEFCIYLVLYSRFIYEQYKKLYGFGSTWRG